MTKQFLSILAIALLLSGCKKETPTTDVTEKPTSVATEIQPTTIKDSVTNEKGEVLRMTFDNQTNTAKMEFNGETIEMKQDTMGSGIQYSNANYKYTEWHNEITLSKDGKTIFTNVEK